MGLGLSNEELTQIENHIFTSLVDPNIMMLSKLLNEIKRLKFELERNEIERELRRLMDEDDLNAGREP